MFFYAHTTKAVDDLNEVKDYVKLINQIRDIRRIKDITVCLHFTDVQKGVNKILEENQLKWISIDKHPIRTFPHRFFQQILSFNQFYSTVPGSYLYYLTFLQREIELIDFKPKLINKSDTAQKIEFKGFFDEFPNSRAYELFDINSSHCWSDKSNFALELLGYDDYINAENVRNILKSALNA